MSEIIASITGLIVWVISTSGYWGVAVLMALESVCLPVPSEVVMPFAGYLVSIGRFELYPVAVVGALGCNIGSTLAYAIGYAGGRPFVRRFGHWVGVSARTLERTERYFARYGSATVFAGRLLPVVRTFISLPAGVARMPMWKFQIYSFLGSLPWCFALTWVGARLGDKWNQDPRFRNLVHQFDGAALLIVFLVIGWYSLKQWRERHR